jgi:hypothetical protein
MFAVLAKEGAVGILTRFELMIGRVKIRVLLLSPPPGRTLPVCYFADVGSTGPGDGVSFATARFRLAQVMRLKPHRVTWRRLITTRHTIQLRPGEWEHYRLDHRRSGHPAAHKLSDPVPQLVLAAFADIIYPQPHEHLPDPGGRDAALQQ